MGNLEKEMFQKLMDRVLEYEKKFEKATIPERKELVDYHILLYRIMAGDEEEIMIDRTEEKVIVRVQAPEIIAISEAPALKQLISLADSFFMRPVERGVELEMDFQLWEWKEKR